MFACSLRTHPAACTLEGPLPPVVSVVLLLLQLSNIANCRRSV